LAFETRGAVRRQRSAKAQRVDARERFAIIVCPLQRRGVVRGQVAIGILATSGFRRFASCDVGTEATKLSDDLAADLSFADVGIGAGHKVAVWDGCDHRSILCKLNDNCKQGAVPTASRVTRTRNQTYVFGDHAG